jgi:hypothetical protein
MTEDEARVCNRATAHRETVSDDEPAASRVLTDDAGGLVDLVSAVLVDPNLHTDQRMRLHQQIIELLRSTHETAHDAAMQQAGRVTSHPAGDRVTTGSPRLSDTPPAARVLAAVLVAPDLHTDMRMRLYDQIPKLIRRAREAGGARRPPPD